MLKFIVLFFALPLAYSQTNLIGGIYSTQASAGVARTSDATSPFLNPAGLGKINKSSISSGASTFSAKSTKQTGTTDLKSSSNHVSYIKDLGRWNLGLMIYNLNSDFQTKINQSSSRNDEDLPQGSSTTEIEHSENNYYILGLSPKDSWWGLGFNLMSFNLTSHSAIYRQKFSNLTPTDRDFSSSSSTTRLNVLTYGTSLGFQWEYEAFAFGAKLNSPLYYLKNDSTINMSSISVSGIDPNNVSISNYNYESELKPDNSKLSDASLLIGASYANKRWQAELDLLFKAAGSGTTFNPQDELDIGLYRSQ
ncbi:MAG: hypothetical protein KC478_03505 [Bacteriovoracaceae bacterium]|nr:hypothetical protein [Bacteriovoracaceae bacterium]